ncbi:MAG: hypothetical protein R3A48_03050 [Polyangiales bacterium]
MSEAQDPIEQAWIALQEKWDLDEQHRAFVALAAALDRLPDAAGRYRALRDDPERGAEASKGLQRVLGAALATLSPDRHTPMAPKTNYLLAAAALACLWIATPVVAKILQRPELAQPWVFAFELAVVLLIPWRRLGGRSS